MNSGGGQMNVLEKAGGKVSPADFEYVWFIC
ncbi:hypothetical protein L402_00010 [Enterobacter asburiae]|uniref:Uncharacterized protein n=1 Tax=Enterobacter asburiae TaxID=61645 RepID=A0ABC9UHV8_ENTAS|nr:hypothetical protein L402_00010 [Enterobacter asburiae]